MKTKKELWIVPLIILVIAFSASWTLNLETFKEKFLLTLFATAIVILLNLAAKKITARMLDCEIEVKLWEIGKYGFDKKQHSKRPFPMGAILPIISKIILFPLNFFVWMASLVFDVKPKVSRSAKRFGLYTFSDVTEYHIGLIAAAGILVNLLIAVIGYFTGFSLLSRLSMYYAFFNMLPLSELDGNKIFFGSLIMWSFLAGLTLIGMLFAIFII
jgi:Zn-dependent protease